MQQLALSLTLRADANFSNFYLGRNAALINYLHEIITEAKQETSMKSVYAWGKIGSGRSHILQAACHLASSLNLTCTYLPMQELHNSSFELLLGLESLDLICIDDIEFICGDKVWEEAFFHLYNKIDAAKGKLIVTGIGPLSREIIQLADLRSRLGWGLIFQAHELSDEEKAQVLKARAKEKGIVLTDNVANFILRHCPRNLPSLFNMLDELDNASLVAKRRLTVPFVKEVLRL